MLSSTRIILSSVLPFLGCVWQFYYIISAFMAYNSVTEINRLFYGRFKPPIFELCVNWQTSYQNFTEKRILNPVSNYADYPTARSRIEKFKSFQDIKFYYFANVHPNNKR